MKLLQIHVEKVHEKTFEYSVVGASQYSRLEDDLEGLPQDVLDTILHHHSRPVFAICTDDSDADDPQVYGYLVAPRG